MLRKITLGLSLALLCQGALAQALYRIKPLGSLGGCPTQPPVANAFNASDQVTGQACNTHGDFHAFLWKNDGTPMVDLGPTEKGSRSAGNDINASGLVAGSAQDSTGQYGFVSSGGAMTKIVNSLGGAGSAAFALNASGQVTGWADASGGATDAFVWQNNNAGMIDLGNQGLDGAPYTVGTAINASGQVAGTSGDNNGFYLAFIWKNNGTPLQNLGTLGGYRTFACCINASGQVAGSSSVFSAAHPHAYLWRSGTGMQDLGTLGKGSWSEAFARTRTPSSG
jgi:probable HAF family extracellular repeat protein